MSVDQSEPLSREAIEARITKLRELYVNGWRPFGTDDGSSRSAAFLGFICSSFKPETYKKIRWAFYSAEQIDHWVRHFEDHTPASQIKSVCKPRLGPKLLGKKGRR
jgi:hypothetical protein